MNGELKEILLARKKLKVWVSRPQAAEKSQHALEG